MFRCTIHLVLLVVALSAPPHVVGQDAEPDAAVVSLNFAWTPGLEADVGMVQRMLRQGQGTDSDVRVSARYRMVVDEHPAGLLVSYVDGELVEFASDPPAAEGNPLEQLYRALNEVGSRYVISSEGELVGVEGAAEAAGAFRNALGPMLDSARAVPEMAQLISSFDAMFTEDAMTAAAADQWGSMIWAWAGEEFEEGMVYGFEAEEPSPLMPDVLIPMTYEMGFLERVPCGPADPGLGCVSLEVYSYPDPDVVRGLIAQFMERMAPLLGDETFEFEELEQENHIVVVLEPATLIPHTYSISKSVRGVMSQNGEPAGFVRLDETEMTFVYGSR